MLVGVKKCFSVVWDVAKETVSSLNPLAEISQTTEEKKIARAIRIKEAIKKSLLQKREQSKDKELLTHYATCMEKSIKRLKNEKEFIHRDGILQRIDNWSATLGFLLPVCSATLLCIKVVGKVANLALYFFGGSSIGKAKHEKCKQVGKELFLTALSSFSEDKMGKVLAREFLGKDLIITGVSTSTNVVASRVL